MNKRRKRRKDVGGDACTEEEDRARGFKGRIANTVQIKTRSKEWAQEVCTGRNKQGPNGTDESEREN